jgi:hypothetical protein
MLTTQERKFHLVFNANPELFRGKRIDSAFFVDIELVADCRVKTTLLVPRYLLTDAIDTICRFTKGINAFEVFNDDLNNDSSRTLEVQKFVDTPEMFRNMDVNYWQIFEGSEFHKVPKVFNRVN